MIAIENQRLKQVREELGMTQTAMGTALELSGSTADIERGRMRVPGRAVMLLLQKYTISPLWLYGESAQKYLTGTEVTTMPRVISVDTEGDENIIMVQAKAAAGYGQNIADEEYIAELPSFRLPLPEYRGASFRGFQISGDSMQPLVRPDDWVLSRAVDSIDDVRDGGIYIIVEAESIRLKQVRKSDDHLSLISLNPDYPPTEVLLDEVLEIWEYYASISTSVEADDTLSSLSQIQQELHEIKKYMKENT